MKKQNTFSLSFIHFIIITFIVLYRKHDNAKNKIKPSTIVIFILILINTKVQLELMIS